MQDSRRTGAFFLSLLLHALLVTLAMLNLSLNRTVDLDKPMYNVDLVSLNQSDSPAAGETGEPAGGPPTLAENQPEEQKEEPAAPTPPAPVKAAPTPVAKPVPQVRDDAKLISEHKAKEEKKKPEPTPPAKTKPAPQEAKKPSREDLLKQALQDVRKEEGSKSKGKAATAKAPGKGEAVAGALAALRKSSGGNIFTAGGTGRGGAGGGKGTGAGGTGTGIAGTYGGIITQLIKPHWRFPTYAREKNIVVTLEITIDAGGKITSAKVSRSSGNAVFDASAVRAAMETGTVPAPPSRNLSRLHLNFNLQEMLKK